ncbi:hypothetical protein D3C76_1440280 [compost metagenome]
MLSLQVLNPAWLLVQPLFPSGGVCVLNKHRSFHPVDDRLVDFGRVTVQHASAWLRIVQRGRQGLAQGQAQLDIVHQPRLQFGIWEGRGIIELVI